MKRDIYIYNYIYSPRSPKPAEGRNAEEIPQTTDQYLDIQGLIMWIKCTRKINIYNNMLGLYLR